MSSGSIRLCSEGRSKRIVATAPAMVRLGSLSGAAFPLVAAHGNQRPTIASTSALRKRSTTSMKPIEGISSRSAVIDEIW